MLGGNDEFCGVLPFTCRRRSSSSARTAANSARNAPFSANNARMISRAIGDWRAISSSVISDDMPHGVAEKQGTSPDQFCEKTTPGRERLRPGPSQEAAGDRRKCQEDRQARCPDARGVPGARHDPRIVAAHATGPRAPGAGADPPPHPARAALRRRRLASESHAANEAGTHLSTARTTKKTDTANTQTKATRK